MFGKSPDGNPKRERSQLENQFEYWMIKIPKHERSIVGLLFIFSLVIATSYVIARTIGDSLFLSRVGNEQLALVFVLSGVATAIVALSWYLLTRKYSIGVTIQLSSVTFALLSLAAYWLLPEYHHSFWLMAAIYLLADIKGCINAINIVSALNNKLGRDASKRSWALVGLAAPIAAVLMGSLLAAESTVISIRVWLLIAFGLDLISMAIGIGLSRSSTVKELLATQRETRWNRLGPHDLRPLDVSGRDEFTALIPKAKRYVCSEQFRRWIGVLIAAKVVVLTIVTFEWKTAVNSYFEGQAGSLVRFFGIYYGAVGLATIGLQVFLTGRLLEDRDKSIPLLLMPILLIVVSFCILFNPVVLFVLILATLGKSLDAWRRSVHDTTLNFLYTRIRRGHRRTAISFNSGLIKPLAEVTAASVIFLGTAYVYRGLLLVVLGVWILAVYRLLRLLKPPLSAKDNLLGKHATTEDPQNSNLNFSLNLLS